MTAVEPQQTPLEEAYQGVREVVEELLPSIDWASIDPQLGFAQLKELVGLPLEKRDYDARVAFASTYGRFPDELGPVWEHLPEVASAVKQLGQHPVIATMPAWHNVRLVYEGVQQFSTRFVQQFGHHAQKIAAHPKVQKFFRALQNAAVRQMAWDTRMLSSSLVVTGRGLTSTRRAVSRLETALNDAASRLNTNASQRIARRAAAASLRSSTGGVPGAVRPSRKTSAQPNPRRRPQQHRTTAR
ncbi:hypothetical protein [Nonomuraea sp. KM90]|uniref:hypothetical protein n=1 Tax=Nonomuraea sp. KM90 TaxID=3457428 RepID=UPI003FCC8C54